jgi:hypothetical protein
MSDTEKNAKDIAVLKERVFKQETAVTKLQDQHRDLELNLCTKVAILPNIKESQDKLEVQFKDMDDELKLSFKDMDDELKLSFEKRDNDITDLKVHHAKMFAYATAAFIVINILIQIGAKFIK